MKFIKTRGIVIKKKDFGEADRIITVFSENFGKIDLLVKGIRKSKRRNQNSTDLMTLSNFTFYKKGDSFILTSIDAIDSFYDLKKDIAKLEIASYINSVINEIVIYGERKKEFFQRIENAIEFIIKNKKSTNLIMLLKMMNWIIKNEGYKIDIIGNKYFSLSESVIKNTSTGDSISLEKEIFEILENISELKEVENRKMDTKILIQSIKLYEKYINYHLDTKIDINKHLFGGD